MGLSLALGAARHYDIAVDGAYFSHDTTGHDNKHVIGRPYAACLYRAPFLYNADGAILGSDF